MIVKNKILNTNVYFIYIIEGIPAIFKLLGYHAEIVLLCLLKPQTVNVSSFLQHLKKAVYLPFFIQRHLRGQKVSEGDDSI